MNYVLAKIDQEEKELLYKVYITDSLKALVKANDGTVDKRYFDLLQPEPQYSGDAKEIKEKIFKKLEEIENEQSNT